MRGLFYDLRYDMLILAFNGSPRKHGNTGTLLSRFLEGAASVGVQTELIHLYGMDFRGCRSCFRCKRLGDPSYGVCAMSDALTPWLQRTPKADAIILGSPVYFSRESACAKAFLERLLFPYVVYASGKRTLFQGNLKTYLVYTMNVDEQTLHSEQRGVPLQRSEAVMRRTFGHCECIVSTDTLQFDDYSKYESSIFDSHAKQHRHDTVFQKECTEMFHRGRLLASKDMP